MVMPLVDEHRPKCHLCHEGFADVGGLRRHLESAHGAPAEAEKGPAPGDVTAF